MKKLEYQVSFTTPAFLGNAEQQAQWRTPPFKALIRQWWRVVHAPKVGYDVNALRRDEGALFGVAADGGDSRRSLVQFRLDHWNHGSLTHLKKTGEVCHPEVQQQQLQSCPDGKPGRMVEANLYLGYGPVGTQGLRYPPAIAPVQEQALEIARLRIVCPTEHEADVRAAAQLAAWFGTLGSRARNGWGALNISGDGIAGFTDMTDAAIRPYVLPLEQCLSRDWPHAIGLNEQERPLVWRVADIQDKEGKRGIAGFSSWHEVMRELARIKIAFRTHFKFGSGGPHRSVEKRHVLAYPVTKHNLAKMDDKRLANQLRFKVVEHGGKYFGVIAHLPCAMPTSFFDGSGVQALSRNEQIDVWKEVHHVLNAQFKSIIAPIRKAQA
ncbi:MAG: hypothetical protein HY323_03180 [Betaproteobacteria bacterium]|nr:hypothetical protein [Betaproteobacteria bacterium]